MLPNNVLSSQVIQRGFEYPRNIPKRDLVDYEYGGVDILDGTRGLRVKVWRGEYVDGQVVLTADDVDPYVALDLDGVTNFSFSFDQNMRPAVAYELAEGVSRFLWYDTTEGDFVTLELPVGTRTPRCCHDDTRDAQVTRGASDVILSYVRGTSLYFRAQRDRYTVEYLLTDDLAVDQLLIQIGMNRGFRMQFMMTVA